VAKKIKETRICSHCINDIDQTEINIALVPSGKYYTLYCHKCIKELGITDFKPYIKPRKKKN
jgi:hypothetical protein